MNRLYLNIQKFSDGKVVIETELNTKDFENGLNKMQNSSKNAGSTIKNIVAGLGITKLISKGLSVISSSIDDAVKRVDTLNNFPKVMSNLGISAEESSEAVDKMSEKLAGLPTTLDQGAAAVQRFTSKNGDVKKSTDLFLALNNAILAGGAPAEIQASALEQLSQSYAKGKPDMMEWRTAMSAMPAQLKQVAIAMGYIDADALGEALREGTVSMDDFMGTITKLNTEGVNGFQSFEEQAKNSTGGIQTAIVVAKTQVVKGVASMIGGINKSLKKSNLGSLSDIISNIGKEAKKQLDNVGKMISKIDFQKLGNVIKVLVPIVGSLVAAFVAYETVLKAISVINLAKNITSAISAIVGLTSATQLSSGAMTIFNSVMSANPIGLLVAGATALAVGLGALTSAFKDTSSETTKTNQVLDDYKKSMDEAREAKQEYLDQNMVEIKNTQDLANELDNLVDENGKVKDGYEERAKFIITQLNDALGTEIKLNNGIIQGYQDIKKSVQDVIEAKRAETLMNAAEKEYNTALEKRKDLEEELNKSTKKLKGSLKEKQTLEKDLSELYGLTETQIRNIANGTLEYNESLKITADDYDFIKGRLQSVNEEYETSLGKLDKIKQKYVDNEKIIGEYQTALGYLKDGNYEAVLKMYEDTTNYQGKTKDETYKNYDAAMQAQKIYLQYLKENQDTYNEDTYKNLVSAGESKLKELEEQQKKYKTVTDAGQKEIKSIWNMSLQEQIKTLESRKVDFKRTADGHIQAYVNGQKSGKPATKEEAQKMMDDITKELQKSDSSGYQAGYDLTLGTTRGIKTGQGDTFFAVQSFGNTILSSLRSALEEHSPSKATKKMGEYLLEGLEQGIDNESNNALKQVEQLGDNILDRFKNINYSDIYKDMQNALNIETSKIGSSVQISGASQSVQQMLTASASFDGIIPLQVDLDGEVIYDNQQKISARKNLQYGGVR